MCDLSQNWDNLVSGTVLHRIGLPGIFGKGVEEEKNSATNTATKN